MDFINEIIQNIAKEQDRLDVPVFLNFLKEELDRKGIVLTVNRTNDLHLVPVACSNIVGVELDTSKHDKGKDSEIEKYKKVFEYAKSEKDKEVSKCQNKIDELEVKVRVLEESKEDLPYEPIKIAEYLIDRTMEVKNTFPALQGGATSCVAVHDVSELRQIAEHLLVYCNHAEVE